MIAKDIHGGELGIIKGMTVLCLPRRVNTEATYMPLHRSVHEHYKEVTVCADVMHVSKICFFVSILRNIKLGIIEVVPNLKQGTILQSMKKVVAVYHQGGFRIRHAVMDGAFECL
jgi:hypothetical protein